MTSYEHAFSSVVVIVSDKRHHHHRHRHHHHRHHRHHHHHHHHQAIFCVGGIGVISSYVWTIGRATAAEIDDLFAGIQGKWRIPFAVLPPVLLASSARSLSHSTPIALP